jgi:hypothetical protein
VAQFQFEFFAFSGRTYAPLATALLQPFAVKDRNPCAPIGHKPSISNWSDVRQDRSKVFMVGGHVISQRASRSSIAPMPWAARLRELVHELRCSLWLSAMR